VIFYPDYFLLFYPFIAFSSFYRDFLISGIIAMDDIHLKPGVKKEAVERQPIMSRRFHANHHNVFPGVTAAYVFKQALRAGRGVGEPQTVLVYNRGLVMVLPNVDSANNHSNFPRKALRIVPQSTLRTTTSFDIRRIPESPANRRFVGVGVNIQLIRRPPQR
jgi:hypothetical protein